MRAFINADEINGQINIPTSKSVAHRAVLAAGLARGFSRIYKLTYSKDIAATIGGIRQLGAKVLPSENMAEIEGRGGFATVTHPIACGESGSTLRFLVPLASLTGQTITFKGARRLFERPQHIYAEMFHSRGFVFEQSSGKITLQGALTPGRYTVSGSISSQFISGLLFAMPLMRADSEIKIIPPFQSRSYVNLTLSVLDSFNIKAEFTDEYTIKVKGNQHYYPCEFTVEGDFSQCAFFAVLGCIVGNITVNGLRHDSVQGDKAIIDILKRCGAKITDTENGYYFEKSDLTATEIDLSDCPDLGPILMVLGLFCKGETIIKNAQRLRLKECDRISAMQQELSKLGADINCDETSIFIKNAELAPPTSAFCSHNDHRVVMAVAVAALGAGFSCEIDGAEAVTKSYPDFFDDLAKLCVKVEISDDTK